MTSENTLHNDELLVAGFPVRSDRYYDRDNHVWLLPMPDGRVRIGLDALNVETTGTLAGLGFLPVGSVLRRGGTYGSLEAAKYVGPLLTPISGIFAAGNEAVLAEPGLVTADPYGAGWLAELEPTDFDAELPLLLHTEAELRSWFSATVTDYRSRGLIAE
ncbi:MAG: glycine cleavage system protein H [Actinobacteria bacterium]|nr:glycine cleavage system protein H [Actinomycetota bacterium]